MDIKPLNTFCVLALPYNLYIALGMFIPCYCLNTIKVVVVNKISM